MPLIVLTGALLLVLWLNGLLELPFTILSAFSVPSWFYLLGAIALLSWCLDD